MRRRVFLLAAGAVPALRAGGGAARRLRNSGAFLKEQVDVWSRTAREIGIASD